jgi:hypothetical protein
MVTCRRPNSTFQVNGDDLSSLVLCAVHALVNEMEQNRLHHSTSRRNIIWDTNYEVPLGIWSSPHHMNGAPFAGRSNLWLIRHVIGGRMQLDLAGVSKKYGKRKLTTFSFVLDKGCSFDKPL